MSDDTSDEDEMILAFELSESLAPIIISMIEHKSPNNPALFAKVMAIIISGMSSQISGDSKKQKSYIKNIFSYCLYLYKANNKFNLERMN